MGFKSVVEMLASLFIENPIDGLRLRLSSTNKDGIVVMVENAPKDEQKDENAQEDGVARKELCVQR